MAKGKDITTEPQQTRPPLARRDIFSPFTMVSRIFDDMDRIFGDFGVGLPVSLTTGWPQVDVRESDGKLHVRADLPGMKKEDVKIELTEDGLVLEGERKEEWEKEEGGIFRSECRYGTFHRLIPLPEGVDASGATAKFDDGVLEVTLMLPKQKEAKTRRIEIAAGKEQPAVH